MSINKPNGDGIDHINVYSQGRTALGRFLSNWTKCDLDVIEDGKFQSVEGYWYWLRSKDDRLRSLYGYAAKKLGRDLNRLVPNQPASVLDVIMFQNKIKGAIRQKIERSGIVSVFKGSKLPFTHYYVYNGTVREAGHEWIIDYLEELRKTI